MAEVEVRLSLLPQGRSHTWSRLRTSLMLSVRGCRPGHVRDVGRQLIAGRVCGQFHQGFVPGKNGLKE